MAGARSGADGLDLSTEWEGSAAVVRVRGEIDFATAGKLRSIVVDLVRRRADPLVLDLHGTTFLDSTGISLIVQTRRRLLGDGRELVLRSPSTHVLRLLGLMNLTSMFTIVER